METDPLLEKLHALPALPPDPGLTERVARAALVALADGDKALTRPEPLIPGWRSYLELALYRAAIPSVLTGATILYLSWAIRAASDLY